jgi:peptide/nickel transport system permease protein
MRPADRDVEAYYVASQRQLIWRKFKKHRLGVASAIVLVVLYALAAFCEPVSPYGIYNRFADYIYCRPQMIHFIDSQGRLHLRPFVYPLARSSDPVTLRRIYVEDTSRVVDLGLFVHGDTYKLWNLFPMDIHLFGAPGGTLFLFGTDKLGRDLFSRTLYAARISLSIGLIGVALSFFLGCLLGGISGYYGGRIDTVIQRVIEILISIPTIPLWMALSAALPPTWSPIQIYFGITLILSLIGWSDLARVVRGKLLELREEDFVMAARIAGATEPMIITRHLLPSFLSYLIVNLTIRIPWMIIGETSLSFLGLGIRPPAVSWGSLLNDAQSIQSIAQSPWLMLPGVFVIIAVMAFNFMGDGLRDAADPYKA